MSIDLDKKIKIKNLCSWDLYFKKFESPGDFKLPANGVRQITVAEVQSQVYDNVKMFAGTDGVGSHAKIYIDDKETRVHLGFEGALEMQSFQCLNEKVRYFSDLSLNYKRPVKQVEYSTGKNV
ncbi:hypothetical protein ABWK63_19010, partial [Bacillus safensis]